jgi:FKBP-type peptidyl-prolyl cis-trans isomerase
MKTIFLALLLPVSVSFAQTKKPAPKVVKPAAVLTSIDSLSYSIGVQVADFYKNQGVEKMNSTMVKKAFDDVYNNITLLISQEQANMTIQQKLQQYMSVKINAEKEEGIKFLEANKKRPEVVTLPSGLQY